MAIPSIQFDPFGDWRRWRQENPDSPLARIRVPPSPGTPPFPQPARIKPAPAERPPPAQKWPTVYAMQQQQAPLAQSSPDESEGPSMNEQLRNYRQAATQDPQTYADEYAKERGPSLYSERPPQPEGRPPMPLPYPDVGPNWEVRRQAAQNYPLTQEAHDDMFRTGMEYDPYNLGGLYFHPGREPQIVVRGINNAPAVMMHEMGHKWFFEDLPNDKKAEWVRDWADHTTPEVKRHMTAIGLDASKFPTESFSLMMELGPEHIPDRMQQQFLGDIFDEDRIAEGRYAQQPPTFVGSAVPASQPWIETDTRHEEPIVSRDLPPPGSFEEYLERLPSDAARVNARIENFDHLDRPLTQEQARELADLEEWRRMRENMRRQQWSDGFDHVPWFNAAG